VGHTHDLRTEVVSQAFAAKTLARRPIRLSQTLHVLFFFEAANDPIA